MKKFQSTSARSQYTTEKKLGSMVKEGLKSIKLNKKGSFSELNIHVKKVLKSL